jgi:hypothetical protein
MRDGVKILLGALGGAIVALLLLDSYSGGMMGQMMSGSMMGGGAFGMLFALLFWVLIVALIVALAVWIFNQAQRR